MQAARIEAHKITKPIQLMAVWFSALLLIDGAFLAAAAKINKPYWLAPTLVIAAIVFVLLFLLGVFLMQTVFRKELQDDKYYSEYLKRQEGLFKDFKPENQIESTRNIYVTDSITASESFNKSIDTQSLVTELTENNLEQIRIKSYKDKRGLFLVHSWRPSSIPGQSADIVIWLQQHGHGPLSDSLVEKVEYELGPKFFNQPKTKFNQSDSFRLEVSAYAPMLCLARVYVKAEKEPLLLERYINFEKACP